MATEKKNPDALPVKKPRGGKYSPVIGDNGINTKPGDNSRYAALARDIVFWPPVDRKDVNALTIRLGEYAQYCIDNDIKPGNLACYAALGINKQMAMAWDNGQNCTLEHTYFIKKVKQFCGMTRELLMQDGKINPITGIFWQKNYDGMKDQQDIVLSPANPLGAPTEQKQLEQYIEDKRKGVALDSLVAGGDDDD